LNWLDDVTIPEPETLWDDYSGRTRSAARQTMTIAEHLNANDLKLTGYGTMNAEQKKVWDAAYVPKNEAYLKARPGMTEKEIVQWKYQRYVKDYLRCVKSVDDSVGRMLDYLQEAGLDDNTVVIYSSDQGWYLGEHGWFDKRWMYEESLRTPLLVRWPGVATPGSVNRDIVSNLDFAETFLAMAGLESPSDMQGRSFVPLLHGQRPDDWRTTFYYHYYEFPGAHSVRRHYGVATDRYRLVHFYPNPWDANPIDEWEMYDVLSDPKQLRSVYGQTDFAAVQGELSQELQRLRRELKVPDEDPPQSARGKPRRGRAR
jgi:arylsulfatase A-like enzyme